MQALIRLSFHLARQFPATAFTNKSISGKVLSQHHAPGWPPRPPLQVLTALNCCLLLSLWSAEYFIAERYWVTTLLTYLPQHLFVLPTVVLLFWALRRKAWRVMGLNLLALAFFISYFMGFNVPRLWGVPADGLRLKVMTYNINYGSRGAKHIVRVIQQAQPAIICLQETRGYQTYNDPVPKLQQLLPGWFMARGAEVTTFSRYPIIAQRIYKMPQPSGRVMLAITVRVQGQPCTIFNTHFSNAAFSIRHPRRFSNLPNRSAWGGSAAMRWEQASVLQHATEQTSNPFIIMGDFNTPPRGLLYRRLSEHYQDAFHAAGWGTGYTFRTDLPVLRIDYIFTSRDIMARQCFVPSVAASDHRPLVADLVITRHP